MINENHSVIGALTGSVISFIGLNYSITEVESVISIVCSVTGLVLAIVSFSVPRIIRLVKKIRKAKEDGIITNDELDEMGQDVSELADGLNDIINRKDKDK